MKHAIYKFTIMALFAFIGGAFSNILFVNTQTASAETARSKSFFVVYDKTNKKGIESYVNKGYPAQNFYASDGKIRLQQGLYNAPGEDGLPMIGMFDNHQNLKMLFRLAGTNESPVIIMKDDKHNDRLVFGLDLNNPQQEPFMATFDSAGTKKLIFGQY